MGQVLSNGRCVNCGLGYFHNSTAGLCEQCPQGSYSDQEKQTTCRSCDLGKTTLTAGSVAGKQCYYICEPGYYLLNTECEVCEVGFYQDQPGSTSCKPCPLGHTTQSSPATSIDHCDFTCNILGMEMSVDGSCVPCPVGMYKDDRSDVTCQPCPYGYTTQSTGAKNSQDCSLVKCKTGERRTDSNTCQLCPFGTYQNIEDRDCCTRCSFGETTSREGSVSRSECITMETEFDPCDLGLHGCGEVKGVCSGIDPSYTCQCCSGSTFQNGVCVDNCEGVCENGVCSKDTEGNPKCRCLEGYKGLRCEQETDPGLGTGAVAGIGVTCVAALLVIVACIFLCFRRQLNKNGESYFPVHRSDLRSSFRAFALVMNPMRFEGRSTRSAQSAPSALGNIQIPRPQWREVENNSNSSGQTNDSYF
ncbi:sushi, von Willebrand factor type A, EGF and pentraxin domain-containing protein 1-like [Mercenaria mercenaria]|uniref:sushi, von Willebrand factor type A, EGF and pentraxin domain-containing protein 1-like n=1 Tax=Mercenaria mercenaria TaxID=6596 RepID=UPI00234F89CE|nr:sushi, von Willebrand factor type A, EGF and pentraxin domain-containing protein 1-like [Mercenaria mercenaria]